MYTDKKQGSKAQMEQTGAGQTINPAGKRQRSGAVWNKREGGVLTENTENTGNMTKP